MNAWGVWGLDGCVKYGYIVMTHNVPGRAKRRAYGCFPRTVCGAGLASKAPAVVCCGVLRWHPLQRERGVGVGGRVWDRMNVSW